MNESLQTTTPAHKRKGIPGSTLKIVAIVCMFIDHFAAIILNDYVITLLSQSNYDTNLITHEPVYIIMMVMRCIGRLGFPLFCFLLIEGFTHTRNKVKYASRLFLFALISEIPFDYAFNGKILEFGYQNVFFTLFIGLITLMAYEQIEIKLHDKKIPCMLLQFLVIVCGVLLGELLITDYSAFGVITIVVMYYFHKDKRIETLAGCAALTVMNFIEVFAFAIYPLTSRYNGQRGLNMKYFFYAFYPAHILLLALISQWLGYR